MLMDEMRKQGIAPHKGFQVGRPGKTGAGIAVDANNGERLMASTA